MSALLLIFGIVLFVGLVVVHEWGHFIAARRNGVEVEEFGIGFPPRVKIVSKKNGTIYSLNWLPLGGFVKLKGENDVDKSSGSFGAASLKDKVKIMLAGVSMNLLVAFLLLTFLAVLGMPKLIDNQFTVQQDTRVIKREVLIGYVEPNSPASNVGLKLEDQVISIANTPVDSQSKLQTLTKSHAGEVVKVNVLRHGQRISVNAPLRSNLEVQASNKSDNPKGHLGVAPTEFILQRSTWSAPIVAGGLVKQFTVLTFKGIGTAIDNLFKGNTTAASEQVSGPIGIFVLLKNGSYLGYQFILMIVAIISLTLAIINVLPIPALDGGRLFVTMLFRTIKRPLLKKTEDRIHGTGFALLMLLLVLITIVDIKRNF